MPLDNTTTTDYDALAEQFFDLFAGYQGAHGRCRLKPITEYKPGTKTETESWTAKTAPTPEIWEEHLSGSGPGIGIAMLLDDGKNVLFGCIDVDIYDKMDLIGVGERCKQLGLPLVVCKSKSGGAHLYLFLREAAPAADVQAMLTRWSAALGYAGCEVFPKQTTRENGDIGNWLNMPFYNCEQPGGTRRCAIIGGTFEKDPVKFLEHARKMQTTLADAQEIEVVVREVREEARPERPKPNGEGVGDGNRDNELTRYAASLVTSPLGFDDEQITALLGIKAIRCDPPFTEVAKFARMIKSARKKFPTQAAEDDGPSWVCATDVEQTNIDWLWRNRFIERRINLVAGLGDVGKDTFCCTLAACVTTGRKWPDGAAGCAPGDVGIYAPEDEAGDTIVPRLAAAGADLSRVRVWTRSRAPQPHEIDGLSVFIVSPLFSLMSGKKVDVNQENQIREILNHWQSSARAQQCTIIATAHLNKKSDSALALRIIGSIATINLVRSAWLIQRDDQDKAVRVFSRLKANLSPDETNGLRFTIGHVGPYDQSIVASFCGSDSRDPDAIHAAVLAARGGKQTAEAWIIDYLQANGESNAQDVLSAGEKAGYTKSALESARKRKNGTIMSKKAGFGNGWVWSLFQ